ncbi:MAG: hypothetical protein JXB03_04870, partial [Spirochaetales bacterium]|nr:hypothetical protein [Spirochaetales bacterium]
MQHHHRGQTAGFLSRCISQLQQRMSYSSDIPGGTHQLTNMLDRTNQRQFIMANTVALVFMLYTFINQLFFNSGWESWQTRAFLLLDAGFGLLILVSIVLVVLEQPLGIPARLMRAYRLGYLSFVLSWAACVSVFEAVTVRGVYTYMVVALIVSLVFFHKLWELAIVFTAGQSVFILLLSSGIVPVPNA